MLSKNWTKSMPSPRNIGFAALVLMGAIVVYNRVVAPHANYVLVAHRLDSAANELSKKKQTILNNVKINKKKLDRLEEKLEKIRPCLFEAIEAKKFFSDIEVMSESVNCTIETLNVSQTRSASKTENHANLSFVGSYRNIVALIKTLQGGPRQVWINSVSIKPISGSSEQLKCNISIVIYTTGEKRTVL